MSHFQYILLEKVGNTPPVKEIFEQLNFVLNEKTNYLNFAEYLYETEKELFESIENDLNNSKKTDFKQVLLKLLLAYTFRFTIGSSRTGLYSCLEKAEESATESFTKLYAERYNIPIDKTQEILRVLLHPICNHENEYPDGKIPYNGIEKKRKEYTDSFFENPILERAEEIKEIYKMDYKDENSVKKYNEIAKRVMFEIVKKHTDTSTKLKLGAKLFHSKINPSYKKYLEMEMMDLGMEIALDWYKKEFVSYYMGIENRSIGNLLAIVDQSPHCFDCSLRGRINRIS